jgi:hypothetical protein
MTSNSYNNNNNNINSTFINNYSSSSSSNTSPFNFENCNNSNNICNNNNNQKNSHTNVRTIAKSFETNLNLLPKYYKPISTNKKNSIIKIINNTTNTNTSTNNENYLNFNANNNNNNKFKFTSSSSNILNNKTTTDTNIYENTIKNNNSSLLDNKTTNMKANTNLLYNNDGNDEQHHKEMDKTNKLYLDESEIFLNDKEKSLLDAIFSSFPASYQLNNSISNETFNTSTLHDETSINNETVGAKIRDDNIDGFILGRFQNNNNDLSNNILSNLNSNNSNDFIKLNLPKSFTSSTSNMRQDIASCVNSSNLSLLTESNNSVNNSNNHISSPFNSSKTSFKVKPGNSKNRNNDNKTKSTGFYQKMIDKLVETGIHVTKSKHAFTSNSQNDSNSNHESTSNGNKTYELINGYESPQSDIQNNGSSNNLKSKKRSSSYKTSHHNTLRSTATNLFKSNELEIFKNKKSSSQQQQQDINSNGISYDYTGQNSNNTSPSKNSITSTNSTKKSKNYNSLPSRNFKVVDDIKLLFDKIITSKHLNKPSTANISHPIAITNNKNNNTTNKNDSNSNTNNNDSYIVVPIDSDELANSQTILKNNNLENIDSSITSAIYLSSPSLIKHKTTDLFNEILEEVNTKPTMVAVTSPISPTKMNSTIQKYRSSSIGPTPNENIDNNNNTQTRSSSITRTENRRITTIIKAPPLIYSQSPENVFKRNTDSTLIGTTGVVKLKSTHSFNSENDVNITRKLNDSFTNLRLNNQTNSPMKLTTFKQHSLDSPASSPLAVQRQNSFNKILQKKPVQTIHADELMSVSTIQQPIADTSAQPTPTIIEITKNVQIETNKSETNNNNTISTSDQESPDSPRKGSLKKSNLNKSPLKVRWKDMIEISNVIEDEDDYYNEEQLLPVSRENIIKKANKNGRKRYQEEFDEDVNYLDESDDDNENDELVDSEEEENEEDTDEDHTTNYFANRNNEKFLKKKNLDESFNKNDSNNDEEMITKDIIISTEKKNYNRIKLEEKTTHQFNLKPLHSTGKQFEKEMSARIEKLNKIKMREINFESLESDNDKFYDEIHCDMDSILYELHSTIEHVRISSMISNIPYDMDEEDDSKNDKQNFENNDPSNENPPCLSRLLIKGVEEKISDVAIICRQFVNNSKSMISSALINENQLKPHIRTAINSLCSLVIQCFETTYKYLYKNEKLDETRQLFIQILNLINTFRNTLNITYLASTKQLNDASMNLLMKQATNLANEISLLIKDFKLIF